MAYRTVVDAAGSEWTVWDTRPSGSTGGRLAVAPGYEHGWVTFERAANPTAGVPSEKLRIAPIPAGWADLSDAEVLRLLPRATPVRPAASTSPPMLQPRR